MNALDAIVQVWNSVSMMRQQLLPTDRVHGIVTDGGQAVRSFIIIITLVRSYCLLLGQHYP